MKSFVHASAGLCLAILVVVTVYLSLGFESTAMLCQALTATFSVLLCLWGARSANGSGALQAKRSPASEPGSLFWISIFGAVVFYALVILIRGFLNESVNDPNIQVRMFLMSRSGYEGIPGSPFEGGFQALGWPLAWLAAFLALLAWAFRAPRLRVWVLLPLGALGKVALATLSSTGLDVLPQKVETLGTGYYSLVEPLQKFGVWNFIRHFNTLAFNLGIHGQSHPFGPEMLYWLIAKVQGGPWAAAIGILSLTALTPVLLYYLCVEAKGGPETLDEGGSRAAFAVAALYASGPAALILSTSGIDSTVTLAFVATGWAAVRAARARSFGFAVLAGVLAFAASLLTVATALLGIVFFAAFLAALPTLPGRRKGLFLVAAVFLAVLFGLHLVLWGATGENFNYVRLAQSLEHWTFFDGIRPPWLWLWLNPLLFLSFAGLGSVALLFAVGYRWTMGLRPSLLALAPLGVLIGVFLQGLGFAECQRIFHWGYAALALLAVDGPGLGADLGWKRLAGFITLNALTAVAFMILLMDHW